MNRVRGRCGKLRRFVASGVIENNKKEKEKEECVPGTLRGNILENEKEKKKKKKKKKEEGGRRRSKGDGGDDAPYISVEKKIKTQI